MTIPAARETILLAGHFSMTTPGQFQATINIIWLSGVRRYMAETSSIGFHAAYITRDGVPYETGMGNAEIGSFMTHLGYGIEAIRFLTAAPPEGLNRLTPQLARALGIDIYENRGLEVITPDLRPSILELAKEASEISAVVQNCTLLLDGLETAPLVDRFSRLTALGQSEFGDAAFQRAVVNEREGLEFEVAGNGLQWCVEVAIPIAVKFQASSAAVSPSFDCGLASTPTEHAVCSDAELSQLDTLMTVLYKMTLQEGADTASQARASQAEWRRSRDLCVDQKDCLQSIYRHRLIQLFG